MPSTTGPTSFNLTQFKSNVEAAAKTANQVKAGNSIAPRTSALASIRLAGHQFSKSRIGRFSKSMTLKVTDNVRLSNIKRVTVPTVSRLAGYSARGLLAAGGMLAKGTVHGTAHAVGVASGATGIGVGAVAGAAGATLVGTAAITAHVGLGLGAATYHLTAAATKLTANVAKMSAEILVGKEGVEALNNDVFKPIADSKFGKGVSENWGKLKSFGDQKLKALGEAESYDV